MEMLQRSVLIVLASAAAAYGLTISGSVQGDGGDIENPAEEDRDVKIVCDMNLNQDEEWTACMFRKIIPKEQTSDGEEKHFTCGANSGKCTNADDNVIRDLVSSLRFETSRSQCALLIGSAKPGHSGEWTCHIIADGHDSLDPQVDAIDVFVSNQSHIFITEPDLQADDQQTIVYNLANGRPVIESTCTAQGGLPEPTFKWFIDDDRNEIKEGDADSQMSVRKSSRDGRSLEGSITLSPTLDDLCNLYKIDRACRVVKDGEDFENINFNLICKVDQGNFYRDLNDRQLAKVLVEVGGGCALSSTVSVLIPAVLTSTIRFIRPV